MLIMLIIRNKIKNKIKTHVAIPKAKPKIHNIIKPSGSDLCNYTKPCNYSNTSLPGAYSLSKQ